MMASAITLLVMFLKIFLKIFLNVALGSLIAVFCCVVFYKTYIRPLRNVISRGGKCVGCPVRNAAQGITLNSTSNTAPKTTPKTMPNEASNKTLNENPVENPVAPSLSMGCVCRLKGVK